MHTHINTTGCTGLTHTAASEHCMDTLADGCGHCFHCFQSHCYTIISPNQILSDTSLKLLLCPDFQLVSISVSFRHVCVPVPSALWPALPLRLKNSREYFPESAKCLGIQPSSSMMWAMWSMEERGRWEGGREERGRKNKQNKKKGKEMQKR